MPAQVPRKAPAGPDGPGAGAAGHARDGVLLADPGEDAEGAPGQARGGARAGDVAGGARGETAGAHRALAHPAGVPADPQLHLRAAQGSALGLQYETKVKLDYAFQT